MAIKIKQNTEETLKFKKINENIPEKEIMNNEVKRASLLLLKSFTKGTVSLNKIEQMINDPMHNRRIFECAGVYAYLHDLNINKIKHPNIYHFYSLFKEMIETSKAKTQSELSKWYKSKYNGIELKKNKYYLVYKHYHNIQVAANQKDTTNKFKEYIRQNIDEFKNDNDLSYSFIANRIAKGKIDEANLYRFIKLKKYNSISFSKLKEINQEIKRYET